MPSTKSKDETRKSIKFVIFNHAGVIGGGERSSLILLKNLDRKKFDPLVIFPKGPYEDLIKVTGIRYEALNIFILGVRSFPLYLASIFKLYLRIKKENPKFIYCNSIQSCHWGSPLGFLLGKPVIIHFRDWDVGFGSKIILKIFRNYFSIANSKAVKDRMIKNGFMSKEKSAYIYNAVDTNKFYPDRKDQRLRIESGLFTKDFLVGIIARLDPWKGHIELVEAVSILNNHITNLKILIVGDVSWTKDKNYLNVIKRKIKEYDLEGRVLFLGFQKDVPKILHGLDLVVIPSRNEPFGRVAIEGIAAGIPVIGADSGGLPELLYNRKLGLLFKTGNAQDLAKKIKYVYDNQSMLGSFIKSEAEKVKKDFLPTTYSSKIQIIFEKILDHENN